VVDVAQCSELHFEELDVDDDWCCCGSMVTLVTRVNISMVTKTNTAAMETRV
jgi:hypothetical protein